MASRAPEFGIDIALSRKINEKYTDELETSVLGWLAEVMEEKIPAGRQNVQAAMKDGKFLIRLINKIYANSTDLPAQASTLKMPMKVNTMSAPFKQMENIENFLKAVDAYGVPKASSFQTVDLYEGRNMAQVLLCLTRLGSECQRNSFNGPTLGPKVSAENKREFSDEQMRMGQGVIGLQMGSNKGATQAGMSFGATRHINDIKVDAPSKDSQTNVTLRM